MISQKQFRQRQSRLLSRMAPDSVLVLPSARLLTRSRDTEYAFRQHSDFWYLTGFEEPDSWFLLSNHSRYTGDYRGMVCQPKDPVAEIWQGRRLGPEQAVDRFGLDEAYSLDELDDVLLEWLDGHDKIYFAQGEFDYADDAVKTALNTLRNSPKQYRGPQILVDSRPLIHEMRLIKSSAEIAEMQIAADISARAHCRAMRFAHLGCYEYQLEAELHHEFAMSGARHPAYGTIVGGGVNACILHYTENRDEIADGSLILIDAGAEYNGYAADITRTFPVNGKFSEPQAALYQLVLDAQITALNILKAGVTLPDVTEKVIKVIASGLCKLGLLSGSVDEVLTEQSWRRFFMHGLGHYLGLDVHDVGDYILDGQPRPLETGMVITVEPGLYIPDELDIPELYRGIGIRIEDNIVITEDGYEMLTAGVPKTIDAIEALMEQ